MNAEIALRSTLLLLFAGGVAVALRGASASVRHRVWGLAFVGLVALPLLTDHMPPLTISRPSFTSVTSSGRPTPWTVAKPAPPTPSAPGERPALQTPVPTRKAIPPSEVLTLLWRGGVIVALGILVVEWFRGVRLTRRGEAVAVGTEMDLPAQTRVLRSAAVDVPVTCGVWRPIIVLPLASREWSEHRLRAVLLHEGAHIRRGDWAWLVFTRLVCAAYWFHPLAWWAAARMRAESERAADDAVLRAGVPAPYYAESLVEIAEAIRKGRRTVVLPLVEKDTLRTRIREILSQKSARGPLTRRIAAGVLVVGLVTVGAFAAVRLVAAPVVVRDGIAEFRPGERLEVVAITEMKGDVARSWDVRGAILPEPFPIRAPLRRFFAETSHERGGDEGLAVRYVILRGNLPEGWPDLRATPRGERLMTAYPGRHWGNEDVGLQDLTGASYQAVRLVVPQGRATADLYGHVWHDDWRLAGFAGYRAGQRVRTLNAALNIEMRPETNPNMVAKTLFSYTLPPEFVERSTKVVVTPNNQFQFEGEAGPQSAYSEVPPGRIQRVEVFSRPIRRLVFADLPMEPVPGAAYVPVRFEPAGLIQAENGKATLPDGTTITYRATWEGTKQGWTAEGEAVTEKNRLFERPVYSDYLGIRRLRFEFMRSPSPTDSSNVLCDETGKVIPDGVTFTSHEDGYVVFGIDGLIGTPRRQMDLILRTSVGPFERIAEARLGQTEGYAKAITQRGGQSVLHIDYPAGLGARLEGKDTRLLPLDASGAPVYENGGSSYSRTDRWIEFNLSPANAKRVTSLAVDVRPFAWVRFPNVALYPKTP